MADDIARQLEEEKIENPAGITECLVDLERRMMQVGLGLADNQEAISADLVREVRLKALPLLLLYQQPGVNVEIPGYAQAGLIRRSAIQTSPGGTVQQRFSVVPVTAKHNLRQVRGLHPLQAKLKVPRVGYANIDSPLPRPVIPSILDPIQNLAWRTVIGGSI
jgi:hypothetical protein